MNEIRLQLALAKAGLASRRHAEELIVAGRVAVNGKIVSQLGSRIDPVSDRVTVDGNPVLREAPAYYLMNKPKGYVTTAEDPEGRPTVFSLLKGMPVRLFSVGRLDYNTEGALLLTNDGELAHALMHPSRGVAKVYHAKFRGVVSKEQLTMLRRGVDLPPARPLDKTGKPLPTAPGSGKVERSAPAEVIPVTSTGRHTWLQFILHEGKNRQIHRMAEAVGSSLLKLLRVEYAGLTLDELAVGEYRPLQSREVLELRQSVGLRPFAAQEGPLKPRAKPEPTAAPAQESRSRAGSRPGRE
ncbi:MAG TPA: pseudouridine synthase, partial [Pseudomonadota bacterium]|nr:pseudouridine synthase [Pseudomonadota bacterium]